MCREMRGRKEERERTVLHKDNGLVRLSVVERERGRQTDRHRQRDRDREKERQSQGGPRSESVSEIVKVGSSK